MQKIRKKKGYKKKGKVLRYIQSLWDPVVAASSSCFCYYGTICFCHRLVIVLLLVKIFLTPFYSFNFVLPVPLHSLSQFDPLFLPVQ